MANRIHFPPGEFILEERVVPANTPPELVRDINTIVSTSNATNFTAVGSTVFFSANDGVNGLELWKTDGTSSGTVLVRDIGTGSGGYFTSAFPNNLTNVNGTLFFQTHSKTDFFQLWKSDGTSAGTVPVYNTPSAPAGNFGINNLVNVSGTLFFAMGSGSAFPYELWTSDGTSAGTAIVHDIRPGTAGSSPTFLTNVQNTLYFRANDGSSGMELWKSDGTSSGTTIVRDIEPGSTASTPRYLVNRNGTLVFRAGTTANGQELWTSDGTSAGTVIVRDIHAGSSNSNPRNLTNVNGTVYFTANSGATAPLGYELWKSNGTSTGTVLVKDINPVAGSSTPSLFADVGGIVYFVANDGASGNELWRTDGTSAGTTLVRDIFPGIVSASPTSLVNVNGTLYFVASNGTSTEIWRSDGTSAGTTMIDLEAGTTAVPQNLITIGDRLLFTAFRSDVGRELFTLREDSTAPIIASITSTSANGTYSSGQSINVTVNFNEAVTLSGGILTLTLDSGGTVRIMPFSGTASGGLYSVQTGQTSPDLNVTGISLASGATVKDAAGNDAVLTLPLSNLATNADLIINPLPPTTVSLVTINAGATQRSRLTVLQVDFTMPLNAASLTAANAITLTRTSGGPATVVRTGATGATGRITVSPATGLVASVIVTFDNADGSAISVGVEHGSLADGRWQLTIPSLNYSSPLNALNLYRLFGDANADGTIGGEDSASFGNAFGSNAAAFDFNADGTIGGDDLLQFGNRFGLSI